MSLYVFLIAEEIPVWRSISWMNYFVLKKDWYVLVFDPQMGVPFVRYDLFLTQTFCSSSCSGCKEKQ